MNTKAVSQLAEVCVPIILENSGSLVEVVQCGESLFEVLMLIVELLKVEFSLVNSCMIVCHGVAESKNLMVQAFQGQ